MGLSGSVGSEMAKFCCDPDSADMSRKSGSMRVLTGPNPEGMGSGVYLFSWPQMASMSSSARGAGISVRMVFLNLSSCSCNPWICSWRDSSRNFFRRRLRLACSRFRSRRSSFCLAVSGPPVLVSRLLLLASPPEMSLEGRFLSPLLPTVLGAAETTAVGIGGGAGAVLATVGTAVWGGATIPADAAGSPLTAGAIAGGNATGITGSGAGTGTGVVAGAAAGAGALACWSLTMSAIPGTS
mmetsp:Transcript_21611/g.47214  ORF Transcript_21611/g.47214 Transcript_21611/m.47214 type:complete len:240 (-) Transcript_21611:666-1385(-)